MPDRGMRQCTWRSIFIFKVGRPNFAFKEFLFTPTEIFLLKMIKTNQTLKRCHVDQWDLPIFSIQDVIWH